jgi:hypothetical protein
MPPQPDGIWQVVYSDEKWTTSKGEDRYRRGIYTFWRRTSPYPTAMALDATSRETCTIRRITTNTPIAAFALLNDPVYIEAAQALARRIVEQKSADTTSRATFAFRQVLARPPSGKELERIVALFDLQRQRYTADKEAARKMAGRVARLESKNADNAATGDARKLADVAAWTIVSNVLLNLDETLNK